MNGQGVLLAKGVPWPPSVEDFYLPGWLYPWITKFTVMVWIAVALIAVSLLFATSVAIRVSVMTYLLKVTAIGAGMWTLASSGWAGLHPMGVAILASTFAWLVAQAVWTWRARIPYVEVD